MASSARLMADFPQWAVAFGTLALAAVTAVMAWKTRDVAAATREMAAEIRRDRELEYRPHLSWRVGSISRQGDNITDPGKAFVANFGRGPLIHCLCCMAWNPSIVHLATTDLFDLTPNSEGDRDVPMGMRTGMMPDNEVAGRPIEAEIVRFGFCEDHLGNFWRFVPYKPPESWREGRGPRPPWVNFYRQHFDQLAKQ